ncbi:WD40-repeat-containing domain protein [Phakopsora pachyrhizi]|uniref:WD40-repeat-containing domain protein n=1 Tax=Phakopsora pachyrhizi TaxID=170000 RepID=A0AAV0AQU2_PHAPC|nr:WD40-repeat-containing domain protein [Phakopsora pachyrhizi]CAH7671532.1 WD40-repeat-containing domain protein [Phakopsora pachyrhizi]
MKWHALLQPNHVSCQPLISDDSKYCFVPGIPLSINVYSVDTSALISSCKLPFCGRGIRLISIHRHPIFPDEQIILVSSIGYIYIFDFLKKRLIAKHETKLLTLFTSIRISSEEKSQSVSHSLTITVIGKKTEVGVPQSNLNPKEGKFKKNTNNQKFALYAIQIDSSDQNIRSNGATKPPHAPILEILKVSHPVAFAASACGNWIGIVNRSSICVIRLIQEDLFEDLNIHKKSRKSKFQAVYFSTPERISCIAFPPKVQADQTFSLDPSPSEISRTSCDFFATGSKTGKIALWHALSEAQWNSYLEARASNPCKAFPCPTSVAHWHAHAVRDLQFTSNGSYLLSGGEEAVLVLWRLEDFSGIGIDSKVFLPRLPGTISRISLIERLESNEAGALITTAEGDLLLVNLATMSLEKRLKLPKMQQLPCIYKKSVGLLSHLACPQKQPKKRYGTVILQSSNPTGLQVLDCNSGYMLNEMLITPKNKISRRDDRPIVEPVLSHMALGGEYDHYMATIDTWVDEERNFEKETTLKLWERDEVNSNSFNLIGQVNNPHEARITSLNVSLGKIPTIVTTSSDSTIKIWSSSSLTSHSNLTKIPGSSKAFEWLTSAMISYRGLEARKTAFSEDGSVLAVLHDSCVTLWDVGNQRYLKVIASGSQSRVGKFKQVCFAGVLMDKIVVAGSCGLCVFDLLTGDEIGFWPCQVNIVINRPGTEKVFVFRSSLNTSNSKGKQKNSQLESNSELIVIDLSTKNAALFNIELHDVSAATFVEVNIEKKIKNDSAKDEILDGLVIVSRKGGLMRYGENPPLGSGKEAASEKLEKLGIKSNLPFSDLLDSKPNEELRFNLKRLSYSLNSDSSLVQMSEMFETIMNMAPHLVPPSHVLWPNLIQPRPLIKSSVKEKPVDLKPITDFLQNSKTTQPLKGRNLTNNDFILPAVEYRSLKLDELVAKPE